MKMSHLSKHRSLPLDTMRKAHYKLLPQRQRDFVSPAM